MQRFWKWLMRANARGILFASVLVLLLACGWWARQELSSAREPELLPGGGGGGLGGRHMIRLGVLDYVSEQLAVNPKLVPLSPFRPSSGPRVVHDTAADDGGGGSVAVISVPPGDTNQTRVVPDVMIDIDSILSDVGPLHRPRRGHRRPSGAGVGGESGAVKAVTLTYHGIIKRPDGIMVGLVDDGTTRRFLRPGDEIGGLRVDAVGSDSLRLRQADSAASTLQMGVPVTFMNGRRRRD